MKIFFWTSKSRQWQFASQLDWPFDEGSSVDGQSAMVRSMSGKVSDIAESPIPRLEDFIQPFDSTHGDEAAVRDHEVLDDPAARAGGARRIYRRLLHRGSP